MHPKRQLLWVPNKDSTSQSNPDTSAPAPGEQPGSPCTGGCPDFKEVFPSLGQTSVTWPEQPRSQEWLAWDSQVTRGSDTCLCHNCLTQLMVRLCWVISVAICQMDKASEVTLVLSWQTSIFPKQSSRSTAIICLWKWNYPAPHRDSVCWFWPWGYWPGTSLTDWAQNPLKILVFSYPTSLKYKVQLVVTSAAAEATFWRAVSATCKRSSSKKLGNRKCLLNHHLHSLQLWFSPSARHRYGHGMQATAQTSQTK